MRLSAKGAVDRLFAVVGDVWGGYFPFVVAEACAALANLVREPGLAGPMVSGGVVDKLMEALRANPSDPEVNEYACGALATLALEAGFHPTILAAGGIQCLCRIMLSHRREKRTVGRACEALYRLSANAETCAAIVASGELEVGTLNVVVDLHPGSHVGVMVQEVLKNITGLHTATDTGDVLMSRDVADLTAHALKERACVYRY